MSIQGHVLLCKLSFLFVTMFSSRPWNVGLCRCNIRVICEDRKLNSFHHLFYKCTSQVCFHINMVTRLRNWVCTRTVSCFTFVYCEKLQKYSANSNHNNADSSDQFCNTQNISHKSVKIILILSFHLHLQLPTGLFPSDFSTKMLYASLWLEHSNIWWKNYKLWHSLLCSFLHSLFTSALLGPNNLLSTLASDILNPCSSLNMTNQDSHPYRQQTNLHLCTLTPC